jgi:hypothetical protein
MTRAILGALMLVSFIQGVAGQDQGSKGSGDVTRSDGLVRSACQPEIEKFCGGEQRRAGRCLRNQAPDALSERCKTALANRGSQ